MGLVGLIGIGSLVGRLAIGALADRLGRILTLVLMQVSMGASYLLWNAAGGYYQVEWGDMEPQGICSPIDNATRLTYFFVGAGEPQLLGTSDSMRTYRHGDSLIALMADGEHVMAFADGKRVDSRIATLDVLGQPTNLYAQQQGDQLTFWHVGARVEQVTTFASPTLQANAPPRDRAGRLLYGQMLRNAARDFLGQQLRSDDGGYGRDPEVTLTRNLGKVASRQDIARALALLGADPKLVDEVRSLP